MNNLSLSFSFKFMSVFFLVYKDLSWSNTTTSEKRDSLWLKLEKSLRSRKTLPLNPQVSRYFFFSDQTHFNLISSCLKYFFSNLTQKDESKKSKARAEAESFAAYVKQEEGCSISKPLCDNITYVTAKLVCLFGDEPGRSVCEVLDKSRDKLDGSCRVSSLSHVRYALTRRP